MATIDDIALSLYTDIDIKVLNHLVECFGDASGIFSAGAGELSGRAELNAETAARLLKKEHHRTAEKEIKFLGKNAFKAISATDGEYPELLKHCVDRPHVIYINGEVEPLHATTLSMVGTREITSYGQVMCDELVRGLAERVPGLVIVSGLAYGVDVACHRAALKYGLRTVAVMGTPLGKIYPVHHTDIAREIVKTGGTIVSEFHSERIVHKSFFAQRNRIVAGLSMGTVVVESPSKGGSLITADVAFGYNRSVMSVPGRALDKNSQGTNMLIKSTRAQMVCSPWDIMQEMGWEPAAVKPAAEEAKEEVHLSGLQKRVMESFARRDIISETELAAECGTPFPALYEALFALECAGLLKALSGGKYEKL